MLAKQTRQKISKARKADVEYRKVNQLVGVRGFVMTYGRNAFGFSNELPAVGGRNPVCVDQDGDCYTAQDKTYWRCLTNDAKSQQKKEVGDHISVVALEQITLTFPEFSPRIKSLFAACTVPINSKSWKRFEYLTLGAIMDYILRNRSADEVLS